MSSEASSRQNSAPDWEPDADLRLHVSKLQQEVLASYAAHPLGVTEDCNQEEVYRRGGYSGRTIAELLQNAADAGQTEGTFISFYLTEDALYCANDGAPLTRAGIDALTHAHLSSKNAAEFGRHGLGFKSVLSASSRPSVISQSISLTFDAGWTRNELTRRGIRDQPAPTLRIPWIIDANREFEADPTLAHIAECASTIVKLPLSGDSFHKIRDQLLNLLSNPEFMLFLRGVQRVHIEISCDGLKELHELSLNVRKDDTIDIQVDGRVAGSWMSAREDIDVPAIALESLPESMRRSPVPLTVALPLHSTSAGQLSALFPLEDEIGIPAYIDCFWHTKEDRSRLEVSPYNQLILDYASKLFIRAIADLSTQTDPAAHFDYLPRAVDQRAGIERTLSDLVWQEARQTALIPGGGMLLLRAAEATLPTLEVVLSSAVVERWHMAARAADLASDNYPHSACYATERRRRCLRLLVRGNGPRSTREEVLSKWLGRLVTTTTPATVEAALEIMVMLRASPDDKAFKQAVSSQVVPVIGIPSMARGDAFHSVRLSIHAPVQDSGIRLVRKEYSRHPRIRLLLEALGFSDLGAAEEFKWLLHVNKSNWSPGTWTAFWDLAAEVPRHTAVESLSVHAQSRDDLFMLSEEKAWQPCGALINPTNRHLYPPALIIEQSMADTWSPALESLGIAAHPSVADRWKEDRVFREYAEWSRQQYVDNHGTATLLTSHPERPSGPLWPLTELDSHPYALADWTGAVLRSADSAVWAWGPLLGGPSEATSTVAAPEVWAAERYGLIETSRGPMPLRNTVGAELARYARVLPVSTESVIYAELPSELQEVDPRTVLDALQKDSEEADASVLGDLLAVAAGAPSPNVAQTTSVPAAIGEGTDRAAPEALLLALTPEEVTAARASRRPFVVCSSEEQAQAIAGAWGCQRVSDELELALRGTPAGEDLPVAGRFRSLPIPILRRPDIAALSLRPLSNPRLSWVSGSGREESPTDLAILDTTAGFDVALGLPDLLRALNRRFDLNLNELQINHICASAAGYEATELTLQCRSAPTIAAKLECLVGPDALNASLPAGMLDSVTSTLPVGERELSPGELFEATYGTLSLKELAPALKKRGLHPPAQWAGGSLALDFVQGLGFPPEYAGERGSHRDERITVDGPHSMPPLHPYQIKLVNEVIDVIVHGERAMLYMPTGSGKTRTAVESIVQLIRCQSLRGPVLWIAQSDELCEQAVHAFREVWRACGRPESPLEINRFWGINDLAINSDDDRVVVATDAKLAAGLASLGHFLTSVALVVIDEAHLALGKNYRSVLNQLRISRKNHARPLLGLTATPYKGKDVEATRQLSEFFGQRRLGIEHADPVVYLQELGVLAHVRHEVISSHPVELSDTEEEILRRTNALPQPVLNRVGQDPARQKRIIDHLLNRRDVDSTLVFAPSVAASQALAGMLRTRGIKAVHLSGETPAFIRRRELERFRKGELQVLVNCDLLTTGVDVPAVQTLYVARPIFSPNAYLQMIGRGLRGPKNGGGDECTIVNLHETFGQFGPGLAFTHLDHLWRSAR